jgi:hypothetical protein
MENVDILCINCENMISPEKLSAHSSICLAPTPQILKLSTLSSLKQVNFRLDKLKCAIESIIHDTPKPLTTDEKVLFLFLSRNISEIIQCSEAIHSNWEKISEISSKIENYPQDFISSCVTVYLERVNLLAKLKTEFLVKEAKAQEATLSFGYFSEGKSSLVDGNIRKIIDTRQSLGDTELKNDFNDVYSVVDDVQSKWSINSSLMSPRELLIGPETSEIDQMMTEHQQFISQKSTEDLQKYFYSKCLVKKLSFNSRHLAQFIQIPDLYRKAKDLKLPVEMWEEFIKDQFEHPDHWVKK